MSEAGHSILQQILILLAASVIMVALFQRLRMPPMLAYLAVGTLTGPHLLGWIPDNGDTPLLAELGVVFLMFTVGLKFSLAQFVALRREVLGLGGGQVVITIAAVALVAVALGLDTPSALVTGAVLAMSSTAMVVKLLSEQVELQTRHGRTAVGILLFQDVAILPFLILVPLLAGEEGSAGYALFSALGKGVLVILLMLATGRWLLGPILHEVAAARSPELFALMALLFALTAAGATSAAGLSMTLGAFLAGMMLGETEFRYQIEADIRPFQDVLLGVFFISIGMRLDLLGLPPVLPVVVVLALALMAFKVLLIAGLARVSGMGDETGLRTGVILAQGGEFGLVLLSMVADVRLLAPELTQILLSTVLLSMVATPLLVRYNAAVARHLWPGKFRNETRASLHEVAAEGRDLEGHVVICGYGRTGQSLARFLEEENLDLVALDLDPVRVSEAREAGERVVYGDATRPEILEAAGVPRARAVVISFDDTEMSERVLARLKGGGHDMPVLVRTRDGSALERLQQAGATEVIPEVLEAGIMLVSRLLLQLGVPSSEIAHRIQEVRRSQYGMLRGFFIGEEPVPLDQATVYRERLHTVRLPEHAFAVGKPLRVIGLRDEGIVVTAVRRGGIRGQQPQPEMLLRVGNALVLYGTPEELMRAETLLLRGR